MPLPMYVVFMEMRQLHHYIRPFSTSEEALPDCGSSIELAAPVMSG